MEDIKHIYHYTKLGALSEILKTNKFLFSDFINANDYKEKSISRKDEVTKYKYVSFTHNRKLELYSYTNAPMWYFYAERSHGVCICFNKQKLLKKIIVAKEGFINYRNGVTHVDEQATTEFLMEKREDWAYENEYRILVDANSSCINDILECITAIYIGTEVTEEEIKAIYQDIPNAVNVFQMYIDKTDGRYNYIDYRNKTTVLKIKHKI